ncbi:Serine carboxypeptidase S28 family protein [Euphorbia peplus]|nr:Serine carboxypeptidase S28 family protein [Euphorbia peplus]
MALVQFNLLFLLLLIAPYLSFAYPRQGLKLSAIRREASSFSASSTDLPPEYEIHYYAQTLDHFNYYPESYATFQQRYVLNFKYWGGANTSSPIFVYTGEESNVEGDILYVGFISELAARFNGLLLYIEHRYYGESLPFGTREETFKNASTFGYLSSEQALADYAQIITDVKKNLSAIDSPVIAVGASYGGMLASWFRMKYPHIVIGSLASSAPILYFVDITPQDGYQVVVSKDFMNTSESCYNTIKQSWPEMDRIAAQPNGLLDLGNMFNVCYPLNSTHGLKDYLATMYMVSAQYDNPPDYYVENLCKAIDGAPPGTDVLGRIVAGFNASIFGGGDCNPISDNDTLYKMSAWELQTCTEMVLPMGVDNNNTMFDISPFDLNNFTKLCQQVFGVTPRPYWAPIQFGGHNIKSALGNFASNIIFSNGLRDPWSAGGILEDISDSIVSIHTDEGAHCLDVLNPSPNDPVWLVEQRGKEIKIIAAWLADYYAKLAHN